ncbi:sigma 54-interacting transcriptional regulator [Psychrosphaera sp. B3R10]|uniref:sigma 54-interacting transcriptional regulator n=1 Tax=unclassified Psychrosphaera TaxID=2641570 RepID=UPI001C0A56B5|nr:sigma 54-interacting transcriptional regulator [Psychrosphaera sp. I2R16]MBU2990745.1 sigma 54-interacting transcriptional regulator [Psychrosphaera sp. B3R10]
MLNHLFHKAPTAMVLIEPRENRLLRVNKQAELMFGIDKQQLELLTATQFFSECLDLFMVFTQQILEQGQAWSDELTIQVSGISIGLEINANKLDDCILLSCERRAENDKRRFMSKLNEKYQAGMFHWSQDETVFEEIERQNQLLLKAVGDGIYGVDTKGNATFVNAAAEALLGWTKEELIGVNIHEAIHYSHADGSPYHTHQCPIFAAFHDGEVHSVDNEVFWCKSGRAMPVEYMSTPVTENGILVGAVVVFRDITQRKKTESELRNALEQVDSLKARLEMENAYLKEELNADFNHHQIIGNSSQVKHMVHQIELVGPTDANVLITGESGTGKELIARAIHEVSQRKARPLIRVNCAAIPAELFESEFFGHVKGAFSGAVSDRLGRFQLADGATIFLDEVGEIPLQLQSKLLRVLQEQQFERVGESTTRKVDVRVIAATNKDLKQLVAENKFREDLYFRLNVFPLHSPPLRERRGDLGLLVKHFVRKACRRFNKPTLKVSLAQMQHVEQYNWPGNIRELENIIERQVILAVSDKLNFEFLSQEPTSRSVAKTALSLPNIVNALQHKEMEKLNIEKALSQSAGKIYGDNGAAELLGLKPTTLASKMKKYQIDRHLYS